MKTSICSKKFQSPIKHIKLLIVGMAIIAGLSSCVVSAHPYGARWVPGHYVPGYYHAHWVPGHWS
jgi:hypothetical protein